METSLTFSGVTTLFGIMVVAALIPSISVLTVFSRSVASGFIHGVFTTLGIALGDILFILIAIFGLTVLVEAMGDLFELVKYLGGAYLIWLGTTLWRSKTGTMETEKVAESSLLSSFMAGLFITLGDQKAILFYLGIFPALFDLSELTYFDAGIIILLAIIAISTKLGFALMADRASQLFQNTSAIKKLNVAAGMVMIGVGVFVILRT